LGIVALITFLLLMLPTDLLLFDLAGIPVLGAIAQLLSPLALGPAILFSPISLLLAGGAVVLGRHRTLTVSDARGPSVALARTGVLLGWAVIVLGALSLGLIILSLQGVLKPLI
jgi:hypothetical protein